MDLINLDAERKAKKKKTAKDKKDKKVGWKFSNNRLRTPPMTNSTNNDAMREAL